MGKQVITIDKCWCGSTDLQKYNEQYVKCMSCSTLLNSPRFVSEYFEVENDNNDFYGKNYWLQHQTESFGHPDIRKRSREDLTQRCLYWLNTILKYKMPPTRSLELGCGPGTLVHLMKQCGFDATGLELSRWVVEYGKSTHGVNIIHGKIEDATIPDESQDLIIMMDVLEHFTDPVHTMTVVADKLKENGIVVIQTPRFNHFSYEELLETNDMFLKQFKDQEHLFLFTQESVERLISSVGFQYVKFYEPLFGYDMFLVASKKEPLINSDDDVITHLEGNPNSRIVLAMLDLYKKQVHTEKEAILRLESVQKLEAWLKESETDREARLVIINALEKRLLESESDREARLGIIKELEKRLQESESDRNARLSIIQELQNKLEVCEKDHQASLAKINDLQRQIAECEGDRQARLGIIQEIQERLIESEEDRAARLSIIQELEKKLVESEKDRSNRLELIHELERQLKKKNSEHK
ncbi:class I SAM-dependent methyltransferase [Paenibacillus antri]|nr:class I SAM-dependent methyltransferase [Paenibacillus antri]